MGLENIYPFKKHNFTMFSQTTDHFQTANQNRLYFKINYPTVMTQLVAKNLFSNPNSRRTKTSKESTGKLHFICESTRDGRQQQPVVLTSSRKYLQTYKQNIKKLCQQQPPTKSQLASILKIQRYWRFHLMMRGKVQDRIIADLDLENRQLRRIERNEQIQQFLLKKQIQQLKQANAHTASELLKPSKESVMEFVQKSMKCSLGRSTHLENLRLELCYHQKELQSNLEAYQNAKQRVLSLRKNKGALLERERDLVEKVGTLNKTLLLENIEKSKLQLECDELRVQNDRLKCKM